MATTINAANIRTALQNRVDVRCCFIVNSSCIRVWSCFRYAGSVVTLSFIAATISPSMRTSDLRSWTSRFEARRSRNASVSLRTFLKVRRPCVVIRISQARPSSGSGSRTTYPFFSNDVSIGRIVLGSDAARSTKSLCEAPSRSFSKASSTNWFAVRANGLKAASACPNSAAAGLPIMTRCRNPAGPPP